MKPGDQIRFLDSTGGGIITRIDNAKKIVHVIDEDGFETPVLLSQVVVVNSAKEKDIPEPKVENKELDLLAKGTQTAEDEYETEYGDTLCVQLAFMPQNIRLLQSTPYDAILINDSNYYLLYTISNIIDHKATILSSGMIEPNMTDTFCEIQKDSLNDWEHLRIQAIPFKQNKTYSPQRVIDVDIKINLVNFFKLHAFTSNEYFDQPAWIINLMDNQTKSDNQLQQLTEKYDSDNHRTQPIKPKHRRIPTDEPLEVDLHINQLLDNTSGMSNAELLQYQLDTFHKTMKENLNRKGTKIVFIHGKGEGVLRKNIEDALRRQYKTCRFQDASFQKYGFGATMVTIG